MILTDEQKEEIEAEMYFWFDKILIKNEMSLHLENYIKLKVAPAIFKILEKEEVK